MRSDKPSILHTRRARNLLLVLFFPCLLLAQHDTSAVNPAMKYQELVDDSDLIVNAQVASKESKWTEGKKSIVTVVRLKVLNPIKGEFKSNEITLEQPGGIIGETAVEVFPSPCSFELQEKAILFVKKHPNEYLEILGKQSVYGKEIFVNGRKVDVSRYVNVLKRSLTDKSAIPAFIDETKKEKAAQHKSLFKKNSAQGSTQSHPMLRSVLKDTAGNPSLQKNERSTEGGVK
jgi:hypothetical protein